MRAEIKHGMYIYRKDGKKQQTEYHQKNNATENPQLKWEYKRQHMQTQLQKCIKKVVTCFDFIF